MNHAITVGGLLLSIGALVGLAGTAAGVLMIGAASMSDAGDDGTSRTGCFLLAGGALLLAGCLAGLVL